MSTRKVVAVFGYNNTRIYDLFKIRTLLEIRLDADLLLIKEGINESDKEVAPHCFDHKPEDPNMAGPLEEFLLAKDLQLVGCLPFSDKGVIGAAHVTQYFGLFGDDSATSLAMLDKNLFRMLESGIELDSTIYKKPFFNVIHSEPEVREVLASKGAFFIKPTAEGNSRGCMKIEGETDLNRWLADNSSALKTGVICEEILSDTNEYSFDGVDGSYWITEKFTTSGSYRAEYQQIVPAPFDRERTQSIRKVLESLLSALGSNGGAFHHEFFILNDGKLASVEPNRRPAGMWIWDLACWAFEGFDPWTRWVDRCAGILTENKDLNPKAFAGVRGMISKQKGMIHSLDQNAIENKLKAQFGEENVRISFLKGIGSPVRAEPRDNSDFLALIALKNEDYDRLVKNLALASEIFLDHLEVVSCD